MINESIELDRRQCPFCFDAGCNNLAVYSDHTFCHSCQQRNPGVEESSGHTTAKSEINSYKGFLDGTCNSLIKRGISEEICKFMDYRTGHYTGHFGNGGSKREVKHELVHIANYYDNNRKMAQKIRSRHKEFLIFGEKKDKETMPLYGQWKWSPNKNLFCIVVEGEIDQLTILQCQGVQYPVVSLPKGSGSAKRVIEDNLEWLLGWKHIILAFDNDDAGKRATEQVVSILEPGSFKVIEWPVKDANDTMLERGKEAVTKAIWSAKEIIPKKVVTVENIIDRVLEQPQLGDSMGWKGLDEAMYGGTRGGEIIVWVGPPGVGKTCLLKDIVCNKIDRMAVGICSFEHTPEDTIRRYVGAKLQLKLHKPGTQWDAVKIREVAMEYNNKIYLYDKQGKVEVDDMFYSMRYMAKARGVKLFIIDNLKALGVTLKKEVLINFMNRLKSFVKDLNVDVMLVSHVNRDSIKQTAHIGFSSKPDTKQWTEDEVKTIMDNVKVTWASGRMPTAENIEGGNDIEAVADYVFYMARNKEAQDRIMQRTLTIAVGKCGRIDSEFTGKQFKFYYDDNGNYVELEHKDFNTESVNDKEIF